MNSLDIKMITCIKINKVYGKKIIDCLQELNLINYNYKIKKEIEYLYIPLIVFLSSYYKKIILRYVNKKYSCQLCYIESVLLEENIKKINLKSILGYKPTYELIGDIIIINKYEKHDILKLAKVLLEYHNHTAKTILLELGVVNGEFRTRKFKYLYGEDKKETIYKENGCYFYIDLEKAYFTQHLATERKELLNIIKENSIVIDMFAGVGPYSILISKNKNVKKIISIDKNPFAIDLLKRNININKVSNIEVLNIDSINIKNIYIQYADHIIMNLPKTSNEFIKSALISCKINGIIHYYSIADDKNLYEESINLISNEANKLNKKIKIIKTKIVRSYSPHKYNIRIDVMIIE